MRRREFIAGLGSAAVWPMMASAQQTTVPMIGFLKSPVRRRLQNRGGSVPTGPESSRLD